MEKVAFETENGEIREFFIEEETRIAGVAYLLVSDSEGDEATAYILKDLSRDEDPVADYVMVEDDEEFEAVSRIFEQMMEDTFERT